jgi:hypothetical protein
VARPQENAGAVNIKTYTMNRYQTIVLYLYELEKYRDTCFNEMKPSEKPKISTEIERCKRWLYNHLDEEGRGKRPVFHGFVVDKRMDLIYKSRLMKKKKEYEELGLVKSLD